MLVCLDLLFFALVTKAAAAASTTADSISATTDFRHRTVATVAILELWPPGSRQLAGWWLAGWWLAGPLAGHSRHSFDLNFADLFSDIATVLLRFKSIFPGLVAASQITRVL